MSASTKSKFVPGLVYETLKSGFIFFRNLFVSLIPEMKLKII